MNNSDMLGFEAINISMYYNQIREYLKWYPDIKKYFIVDFEELVSHPDQIANKIFKWMNLKKHTITNIKPKNVTPAPTRLEERIDRYSIPWNKFIPGKLRSQIRNLVKRYDTPIKKELTADQKNKLIKWLHRDMKRFEKEFHFPVDKWGF